MTPGVGEIGPMTPGVGEITVWNDYICPWAYAGRDRTDGLRRRGAVVRTRSYELHPELPVEGRPIRPGGRLDRVLDHIAEECAATGRPFNKPTSTPNSRRCLEAVELVSVHAVHAHHDVDEAIARAYWVDGRDLGDLDVVFDIVGRCLGVGAPGAPELAERLADGEGSRLLDAARVEAHDTGVTATPAWRIGELTITGLHPAEQFERWTGRLLPTAPSPPEG